SPGAISAGYSRHQSTKSCQDSQTDIARSDRRQPCLGFETVIAAAVNTSPNPGQLAVSRNQWLCEEDIARLPVSPKCSKSSCVKQFQRAKHFSDNRCGQVIPDPGRFWPLATQAGPRLVYIHRFFHVNVYTNPSNHLNLPLLEFPLNLNQNPAKFTSAREQLIWPFQACPFSAKAFKCPCDGNTQHQTETIQHLKTSPKGQPHTHIQVFALRA